MKIKIIDTNRGQVPGTIKEALEIMNLNYYQVRKALDNSDSYGGLKVCSWGPDFIGVQGYHFHLEATK